MSAELSTTPPGRTSDPIAVLNDVPLSDDEARYVGAARSANTMRGYRSDWNEWCAWCDRADVSPLPAPREGISRYLTFLAGHGPPSEVLAKEAVPPSRSVRPSLSDGHTSCQRVEGPAECRPHWAPDKEGGRL